MVFIFNSDAEDSYWLSNNTATFKQAFDHCEKMNGTLADPKNQLMDIPHGRYWNGIVKAFSPWIAIVGEYSIYVSQTPQ